MRIQELVTTDFLSAYNKYLPWRNPLGILALSLVAAIACGLYVHGSALLVAHALGWVIGLGLIWPWLCLAGVRGTVTFDRRRVREGEAVLVRVRIRNRLPIPAIGLAVGGRWDRAGTGEESPLGVVHVGPLLEDVVEWEFTPTCRGRYPLESPRLTCGFPFGVWRAHRPIAVVHPLLVWPRAAPVPPIPFPSGSPRADGRSFLQKAGTAGEVLGTRPYRRGDSVRRIHWGQTARHDRLIVCERQTAANPSVHLLLDTDFWTSEASPIADSADGAREWAIRLIAGFAEHAWRHRAHVTLAWGSKLVRGTRGEFLDFLAELPDHVVENEGSAPWQWKGVNEGVPIVVTTLRRAAESSFGNRAGQWVVIDTRSFHAEPIERDSEKPGIGGWWRIDSVDDIAALRGFDREPGHHVHEN